MKNNPQIAASAITRYTKAAGRPAVAVVHAPEDRVEISDRAQLYASLLKAARQPDEASEARLHAIVNRLASASPALDLDRLAGRMIGLAAGAAAAESAGLTAAAAAAESNGPTGLTAPVQTTGQYGGNDHAGQ